GGSGNIVNVYRLGESTSPIETINGNGFPYALSLENKGKPNGEVVESDIETHFVYAFAPGSYTPYATLTNGVELPTGLLLTKPEGVTTVLRYNEPAPAGSFRYETFARQSRDRTGRGS
ncbi:MAG: hypothetical protein WBX26_05050, partial [Candidatus Cybelea sp.]